MQLKVDGEEDVDRREDEEGNRVAIRWGEEQERAENENRNVGRKYL